MSKKKPFSIYPGPPLKAWMAHRPTRRSLMSIAEQGRDASHTISETVAINRLAERYQLALAHDFPLMHEASWIAAAEAMNGQTEITFDDLSIIASLVADDRYGGPEEIPEGQEPDEIVELLGCTVTQRLAVGEVVERVWGCEPAMSLREAIAAVSNRPPWSVYRDDPPPESFWRVEALTGEGVDGFRVTHTECPEVAVRVVDKDGLGYRVENPEVLSNTRSPLTAGNRVIDDIHAVIHSAIINAKK